ncbi:MAG TPA: RNase adapter RapZ [Myxococcota bacterium]|nr:RNase adapter RapZ [Myxococcota bacterium]HNZ03381.1 RNase adapter RapZ [Myxococcota bacterium]HOD06639.1 RNase adapter RapZ [Myxococcota bacterium]HPB50467.1 RNase adapter RapZ [Myxococcota bacterium]HQP95407.1 RNase adapter RapZ [Myxococcota bacterium]
MNSEHIVIVTGLSGSGKTTVIKAMEDLGFFCVDNLPLPLLDKILFLAETHSEVSRICIGIDVRERSMLDAFPTEVSKVRELGHRLEIIYLEASEDAIVRRYSETRRRHPLESVATTVREGIARESAILANIKRMADWVIDTTDINIHDLTAKIQRAYDKSSSSRMAVEVVSFGFRDGVPRDASYVFDCRVLDNPHFVEALRPLTGAHVEILEYLKNTAAWRPFLDRILSLLEFSLPLHERESRPIVTVAFGCTGGRHRSVAVAETVAGMLSGFGYRVRVGHRNQEVAEEIALLKAGAENKPEETI